MKKNILLIAIISWVAVLVALIFVGRFLLNGSFSRIFESNSATVTLKEEDIALSGITEILVECDSMDIELYAVSGLQMRVVQYGGARTSAEELFSVTRANGSLKISTRRIFRSFSIGFSIGERLEVQIPQTWLGDADFRVSSGRIRLNDAFSLQDVSIASSSGDLHILQELDCANLSLATNSGRIQASAALTVAGKLSAEASSGDIRLDAPLQAHSIYAKAYSGRIALNEAAVENFDLRVSSGNISVAGLSGAGRAECHSGSINIGLREPLGNVEFSADSGDIHLGVDPALSFNFAGNCSSGSIRADFPLDTSNHGKRASASVGSAPAISVSATAQSGDISVKWR